MKLFHIYIYFCFFLSFTKPEMTYPLIAQEKIKQDRVARFNSAICASIAVFSLCTFIYFAHNNQSFNTNTDSLFNFFTILHCPGIHVDAPQEERITAPFYATMSCMFLASGWISVQLWPINEKYTQQKQS